MEKNTRFGLMTILYLLLISASARAQHFVPSDKGSKVEFSVKNQAGGAATVKGILKGLKGSITFDPKKLATSSFDVTINATSVNTGITQRDQDLKKEDFFNAVKFPKITFKSTSVTTDRPGDIIYVLNGMLTIKGITKPVKIQFMATPSGSGYLFRGSFQLNRTLFNVGKPGEIDNNVTVFLEVNTEKK